MRQHESGHGKSGRNIRETLKEVRKAKERAKALAGDNAGTDIADANMRADATAAPRNGGTGERRQDQSRILERLTDDRDLAARLAALKVRQQRLPLDMEALEEDIEPRTRTKETRDELVERLLDPVLTLLETAILLDVCPTTVRRYTNRGVLNCFRTPGNQRRFRLSDIIDFMEHRDTHR